MAKMAHLVDPDWVDLTEIELYNKKTVKSTLETAMDAMVENGIKKDYPELYNTCLEGMGKVFFRMQRAEWDEDRKVRTMRGTCIRGLSECR